MNKTTTLPDVCMSVIPSTGELITIIKGESGYHPSDWNREHKQINRDTADLFNERGGISKAQEAAMLSGSLFGWDTPAANPANYDENGSPIKQAEKGLGENAGYTIIERYAVGDTIFVIGERLTAPSPYVTWMAHADAPNNYELGHYLSSLKSAQKDFRERVACEALSDMGYSTRMIKNRHEPER